MSRAKVRKAGKTNGHHGTFKSLGTPGQRPPLQQQMDMLLQGLENLAHHLSELDLMVEFTMRQIRLGRVIPGALVGANGKPPMEQISLGHLYEQQRDAFAEQLLKERHEIARTLKAAQDDERARTSTDTGDVAPPQPGPDTDAPTGPSLIILPGGKGN